MMTSQLTYELKQHLKQMDVETAIMRLIDYFKDKGESFSGELDRLRWLQNELMRLEEDLNRGIIEEKDYFSQLDRMIKRLLELINDHSGADEVTTSPLAPSKSASKKTSVIDLIKERIKEFPGFLWPNKNEQSSPSYSKKDTASKSVEIEDFDLVPPPAPRAPEHETSASAPPDISAPESEAPKSVEIKEKDSPFQKGKILYAIPERMSLADASRCIVRIAPDDISLDEIQSGLSREEKEIGKNESLKITQVMKVELVEANDLDNFDITARNSEEQPILPFGFTEWTFDVKSKRPGHYALLLRVSAKINIPSFGERAFDVAVLDRAVVVTTSVQAHQELIFTEQEVPDPSWDENDEQAVIQALELGRTDKALERVANFVQDKDRDFHTEIIMLQSRWNDNANQLAKNLVTASDWDVVNNRIRHSILQLLESLKSSFPLEGEGDSIDWKKEKEVLVNI